jgi:radical SAM superfamily enzyme YgiQ (UPF0313 family)
MKIGLIKPSMGKFIDEDYVRSWSMQPLEIAVLAGMTPDHHEIKFVDDRFDEIDFSEDYDLVAIPVETYTAKRAYNIARRWRERGVPVVMGGIHVSLCEDEVRMHSDYTVVGGAEDTWVQFLDDFEKGVARETYRTDPKAKTLGHVRPRREIFDGRSYLPLEMVETGRGCPFSCDFCAIHGAFQGSYSTKELDAIVEDIAGIRKKFLYFVDDNFVSHQQRTIDLCREIAPLKKKWFSHGSITMTNNEKLMKALSESGCANILIGFESLNPKVLKAMGKSWNTRQREYNESLKKLRDHGITVYGTFVFGYDEDEPDTFERTLEFALEQKMALAAFNHLVPFPGTGLYQRLSAEKRLLYDPWWLDERSRFGEVTYRPKTMAPDELAERCFDLRNRFYSYSNVAKRACDLKANIKTPYQAAAYMISNLTSHKGVAERQYWPIGDVLTREDFDAKHQSLGNG